MVTQLAMQPKKGPSHGSESKIAAPEQDDACGLYVL
jgi:hypothetical protein